MVAKNFHKKLSKLFSAVASLAVATLGCLVLIGWIFDVATLKGVLPGLATMKVNTALAFIWLALALGFLIQTPIKPRLHRLASILAGLGALLGGVTLCQYLFGWDLGIDQFIFLDQPDLAFPGRMAPTTAFNFVLLGVALVLLDRRLFWVGQLLTVTALLIGFLAMIGYLYGISSFYGIATFTSMALHTAVSFFVLGLGILASRPDRGPMAVLTSDTAGGVVGRRLLPAAAAIPVLLGGLLLIGQEAGLYSTQFGTSLYALTNVAVLTIVILWSAASLYQSDTARQRAEEKILAFNRELEERVAARTAELEAANRELEAFSYSVSHDLRAPLRAIDGFSRILLEDYAESLPQEGQEFLQDVRESTQHMGDLVDDLLTFSRLSRQPLKKKSVSPNRIVQQCLEDLSAEQKGRQVEIHVDDLPPCAADPALLKQVWLNLISNALKYTGKKEVAQIEIGTHNSSSARHRTYFVKDNGVGFDMRYADKLFGVFQRLHRAEDYEGTGVGLAIVQRILHRHGGRIWADATPEKGTTFYFTLEKGDHG